ncbi:MAG: histidine kinase, partial [Gammaproteobacteria bacterium]|nr:histidine kinase [Gammaproteobacteria bacterium]
MVVAEDRIELPTQGFSILSPEATVLEAISLMADKGIGALVVTHEER